MGIPFQALLSGAQWRVRHALMFRLLERRPDDQFVASFPRSGSTWLRTVVTNVLIPEANSNPDVFNARIPGIGLRNLREVNALPSPRLLKTHGLWQPRVDRAVYLARDGRDAVVSFYHYLVTRRQRDLTFEEFYALYRQGAFGPPWHAHVESWLGAARHALGDHLHVVPFQDLRGRTEGVLAEVLAFLGIEATAQEIAVAIEKASLERMRKIERSRRGEVGSRDASFYRGGTSGQWADYFTPEIETDFAQAEAEGLSLYATLD